LRKKTIDVNNLHEQKKRGDHLFSDVFPQQETNSPPEGYGSTADGTP
jgi:hypothetical protein